MPNSIRIRNARGELIEAPEVSASDAKNSFGRILERVAKNGGITITRRSEPIAVIIPVEAYARLAGNDAGVLDTLSAEFDALLARMQSREMAKAMQRAFDMSPEQLGHAAVRIAVRKVPPRRAKAASKLKRASKARS